VSQAEVGRGQPWLQSYKTQNVNGHSPALNVFWMPEYGHWASRGKISRRQEHRSNPEFFKARTRWMTERIPSKRKDPNSTDRNDGIESGLKFQVRESEQNQLKLEHNAFALLTVSANG
jgi:hypothetical protein